MGAPAMRVLLQKHFKFKQSHYRWGELRKNHSKACSSIAHPYKYSVREWKIKAMPLFIYINRIENHNKSNVFCPCIRKSHIHIICEAGCRHCHNLSVVCSLEMSQTVDELMLGVESQPVRMCGVGLCYNLSGMCSVDLSQSVSDWE